MTAKHATSSLSPNLIYIPWSLITHHWKTHRRHRREWDPHYDNPAHGIGPIGDALMREMRKKGWHGHSIGEVLRDWPFAG
jgi:hypothetical protein